MAKREGKRVKHPLLLGMVIYAVIFLGILAAGLKYFWSFMAAYETSRPANTIEAYAAQLTSEDICDACGDLIAQVDPNLQTEEECRQVILEAVSGGVTYAKKTSESTDTQMVYVLRCGSHVIGSVTMTNTEVDEYGFARWQIAEERFDLSFLLGEPVSVTVPSEFAVLVNGKQLDSGYITQEDIHYPVLEAFYDDYTLPAMVTYQAGAMLGSVETVVLDGAGERVVFEEDMDVNQLLNNCTEQEVKRLQSFGDAFLERYVAFTGSAHKSSEVNYAKLLGYVVNGSDLHNRMRMALDGLGWAQSNGDKLISITYNQFVNIGDGRYMCDATYEVDTSGREGVVRTTNNVRFIIVNTAGELRVEMLTSY